MTTTTKAEFIPSYDHVIAINASETKVRIYIVDLDSEDTPAIVDIKEMPVASFPYHLQECYEMIARNRTNSPIFLPKALTATINTKDGERYVYSYNSDADMAPTVFASDQEFFPMSNMVGARSYDDVTHIMPEGDIYERIENLMEDQA